MMCFVGVVNTKNMIRTFELLDNLDDIKRSEITKKGGLVVSEGNVDVLIEKVAISKSWVFSKDAFEYLKQNYPDRIL